MDILTWIIFGLIAALAVTIIDRHAPSSEGILGAVLVGIVGAVIGGLLGNMFFGVGLVAFDWSALAIAIVGSLFLLTIQRGLKRIG
jgi:uncharacterized membrane protein YeaQ/YmgE (transglycosylase-associated protein family)